MSTTRPRAIGGERGPSILRGRKDSLEARLGEILSTFCVISFIAVGGIPVATASPVYLPPAGVLPAHGQFGGSFALWLVDGAVTPTGAVTVLVNFTPSFFPANNYWGGLYVFFGDGSEAFEALEYADYNGVDIVYNLDHTYHSSGRFELAAEGIADDGNVSRAALANVTVNVAGPGTPAASAVVGGYGGAIVAIGVGSVGTALVARRLGWSRMESAGDEEGL